MRVPPLNFEGGPGAPLFLKGGGGESRVPVLNFKGGLGSRVPGPTFTPCLSVQMLLKCEFWKKKSSFL